MGLDTYAMRLEHAPREDFQGISLCGGMFSGTGDASFRGKVYAPIVERITGVSLYQQIISPEDVATMANDLRGGRAELVEFLEDEGEADSLIKFFEVCKEHNYLLHGWW